MSKTSPGPWRWDFEQPYRNGVLIASDGAEVCDFGGGMKWEESAGTDPDESDARLISAAPEMLALLRECALWYCGEDEHSAVDRRALVRALLARIDGEP